MYTAEMKSKLDTIASVFAEYINASNDMELLWSEKLGYVFICLEHYDGGEVALNASQIEVPEDLVRSIFLENALDTMAELFGVEAELDNATDEQKQAVRQRLSAYTARFPEYAYLLEEVFEP